MSASMESGRLTQHGLASSARISPEFGDLNQLIVALSIEGGQAGRSNIR
jgi:hypothetical protein